MLYAYSDGTTDRYLIYYWLGGECGQVLPALHCRLCTAPCGQDEAGAAALRTVELDQRLGGLPVQVGGQLTSVAALGILDCCARCEW